MPVTLFMWLALGGFLAAAAVGLALLMAHARRKHVPVAPALLHGFFAGGGLILLLIGVIYGAGGRGGGIGPWEVIVLVIFGAAATLGATLLYLHIRTGSIPMILGYAHGGGAALGIVVLFLLLAFRGYTAAPPALDPTDTTPADRPAAAPGEQPPPPISPRAAPPTTHGAEAQPPVPGAERNPLQGPPTLRDRYERGEETLPRRDGGE